MKKVLCVLLLLLVLLPGCAGNKSFSVTEEEVKEILEDLLPASEELNQIYFGEGLPISEDEALIKAFYDTFEGGLKMTNYLPVDPACGYTSVADIKEKTLAVFTEDYGAYLFERAFSGISAIIDEGSENEYKESVSHAMYLERSGILTARRNLAEEAIQLGRQYHLEALTLLEEGENYILVSVPSELNGREADVELKLVKTEEGWRLDSPTY